MTSWCVFRSHTHSSTSECHNLRTCTHTAAVRCYHECLFGHGSHLHAYKAVLCFLQDD